MISQDQKPHGNTILVKKKKEIQKVLFCRSKKWYLSVLLQHQHQAKSILH